MFKHLAHVCLNVHDIARTIDFYHGKIGLPVQFTFMKQGRLIGAYFRVGERTFIEAFEMREVVVANTGITHFCLEVDDIDAFIDQAQRNGVACSAKKLGCDQSWQTWLRDPDGNRFEVHQYTRESAQVIGGVVEVDW